MTFIKGSGENNHGVCLFMRFGMRILNYYTLLQLKEGENLFRKITWMYAEWRVVYDKLASILS